MYNPFVKSESNDNLLRNFVICSWKEYETPTLNKIKGALKSWHSQQLSSRISPKCPIDYFIVPIDDDMFIYCVMLSKEQALMWHIDNINLPKNDIDEITKFNCLCAYDFHKFFNLTNKSW
jgi:hypothetical protein